MHIKICLLTLAAAATIGFGFDGKTAAIETLFAQESETVRCTVRDLTGTPLNVRDKPNGKRIVGKLKNGTHVFAENFSPDAQDRSWAEVRLKNNTKPLGWVLQEHLECE